MDSPLLPKRGERATPIGSFYLRECWYRADRIAAPQTSLPLRIITRNDGWCDDPKDKSYNTHVKLPFPASHERLWLEEHTYDIVVPIGFNDNPVVPGLGSAIFFHLTRQDYSPTLGCVAVQLEDMLEILKNCHLQSQMVITGTAHPLGD